MLDYRIRSRTTIYEHTRLKQITIWCSKAGPETTLLMKDYIHFGESPSDVGNNLGYAVLCPGRSRVDVPR